MNIKNLKGIEYFTSLGTLFCERNNWPDLRNEGKIIFGFDTRTQMKC